MFNAFREGIKFIRANPSLLLSLFLIIVIPLSIFLLTSFLAKSFQENTDLTLQKEALAIQSIFSPYAFEYHDNPEMLQKTINYLTEQNPDLSQLRVFIPAENDSFKIIASRFPEEKEKELSKTSLTLAWHKNQAIAFLSKEKGIRFWNVIRPFYGPEGEKIGLTSIALSLEQTDNSVAQQLTRAYLFGLIIIVFILLLIIQHTRLFQYVSLFNKLRQIDKTKDSFMNMAVHELRSPVVNIRNYVSELKEEIAPLLDSEKREDLSRIEISVQRLNDLISDILDVVRIEQGRLSFASKVISPVEIINEVKNELAGKARQKGLAIEFDESQNKEAKIKVNPNRFKEVLYNLVDNAVKYTKKGRVAITTKKDIYKKKFYIVIEDTGIGVSAEEQGRLFERFYRVRNKETIDIGGTGLGLWIVKRLCKKMKGVVLLESIKGVGSKFILIFPLFE